VETADGVDAGLRSSRLAGVGEEARGARPERGDGEAIEPHCGRRRHGGARPPPRATSM
jgi:hypothetical protein